MQQIFQRAVQSIMALIKSRFLPWLIALGSQALILLKGIGREWVASVKAYAAEFVVSDDPDYQDLQDFLNALRGRESKMEAKLIATMNKQIDQITRQKRKMLLKFDQQTLRLQGSGFIAAAAFNENFRLDIRGRLSRFWDDAEARARAKIIEGATAARAMRQSAADEAERRARAAFTRAEDKRAQIAALRSPKFIGRSDTQVAGYLKTLNAGTATHSYTEQELKDEIEGRKRSGKWNPK